MIRFGKYAGIYFIIIIFMRFIGGSCSPRAGRSFLDSGRLLSNLLLRSWVPWWLILSPIQHKFLHLFLLFLPKQFIWCGRCWRFMLIWLQMNYDRPARYSSSLLLTNDWFRWHCSHIWGKWICGVRGRAQWSFWKKAHRYSNWDRLFPVIKSYQYFWRTATLF